MSDDHDNKSPSFFKPDGVPMLVVGAVGTLVSGLLAVRDLIGWVFGGRK